MRTLSEALNPDVVKTGLDKVFYQEFDTPELGANVTVEDGAVFKQARIDRAAVIQQVYGGTPLWENRAEEQDVPNALPRLGNTKTDIVTEFAQQVHITKWFFDDNMFDVYGNMVRDMARKGRMTRDYNGFGIFRNAFTTALTADGVALVSDSHVTLSGATVDNKITAALSETSLNDAIIAMYEQKGQSGVLEGSTPSVLVVPPALFKLACEITESDYRSGTADNDMNVYSTKYNIRVVTSRWLGAAAGGSDTAWFLLGSNHTITRYVRQDIETALVDWRYSPNNNYIYKGSYREVLSAVDYVGIIGSTGLT